jgi:hypothetical protein
MLRQAGLLVLILAALAGFVVSAYVHVESLL